jgi:hypothetical protein
MSARAGTRNMLASREAGVVPDRVLELSLRSSLGAASPACAAARGAGEEVCLEVSRRASSRVAPTSMTRSPVGAASWAPMERCTETESRGRGESPMGPLLESALMNFGTISSSSSMSCVTANAARALTLAGSAAFFMGRTELEVLLVSRYVPHQQLQLPKVREHLADAHDALCHAVRLSALRCAGPSSTRTPALEETQAVGRENDGTLGEVLVVRLRRALSSAHGPSARRARRACLGGRAC